MRRRVAWSCARALGLLLFAVLAGCGGRPFPTVPPLQAELYWLERTYVDGGLNVDQRRRLAFLIDRLDNSPTRADEVAPDTPAAAWRGWARRVPGWPQTALTAAMADPTSTAALALVVLIDRFAAPAAIPDVRWIAARATLRPAARCLVDGMLARRAKRPGPPCGVAAADDARAAMADGSIADDPEAARWRATLALWGPAPDAEVLAETIDGWISDWPVHATAWEMAGAAAAADLRATPAERLAWAGAAWHRALELGPEAVRARLALADFEARFGFPAAADEHLRASGLPSSRLADVTWARPGPPVLAARILSATRPLGPALRTIEPPDDGQRPLLDRTVLDIAADGRLHAVRQIASTSPHPIVAPGCVRRSQTIGGQTIAEQICAGEVFAHEGYWHVFPTGPAPAQAELVVRSHGPVTFESHGGAPGARVAADGRRHTFTLDDLPQGRRPMVRVVPSNGPAPAPGVARRPAIGMVDRFEARQTPSVGALVGGLDPARPDVVHRLVARLDAAGLGGQLVWLGRARAVVPAARLPDGELWRPDGRVDGALVAASPIESKPDETRRDTSETQSNEAERGRSGTHLR